MVANKRYQIFVSSTQADLRNEREAIINELTKVGYIAVGMEQFPATDEEQMDFIRPVIDESDYYIVVIKGRYGSLGGDGVSYTEKEFRYAVETKKPAMAFLYKDVGALRVSDTDNDPEKMGKLRAFRAELEEKRIVKHWLTIDELVSQVKDSINDMVRRRPAVGWIRGDQAFDPEIYRERDELKKENKNLREKIAAQEVGFPDGVAHGTDILDVGLILSYWGRQEGKEIVHRGQIQITYDRIISFITNDLYAGEREGQIERTLARKIMSEYQESADYKKLDIGDNRHLIFGNDSNLFDYPNPIRFSLTST
jgi:Domain of unknown function (DUF4062)